MKQFWHKFWYDKQGRLVVIQPPNAPLFIWLIATLLRHVASGEAVRTLAGIVGGYALLIWALLEATRGVNYFRRALGLAVIAFGAYMRFRHSL